MGAASLSNPMVAAYRPLHDELNCALAILQAGLPESARRKYLPESLAYRVIHLDVDGRYGQEAILTSLDLDLALYLESDHGVAIELHKQLLCDAWRWSRVWHDIAGTTGLVSKHTFAQRFDTVFFGTLYHLPDEVYVCGSLITACAAARDTDPFENTLSLYENADIDLMIEAEYTLADVQALARRMMDNCDHRYKLHAVWQTGSRYQIIGLPRKVDVFCVKSAAAKLRIFHVDCVRAAWNRGGLRAYPSFMSALHSGLNFDLRWCSSQADVRNTVLKYEIRGFQTRMDETSALIMQDYKSELGRQFACWSDSDVVEK